MTRYDAFWLALTVGLGGLAVSAPAKAQGPLAPINHNPTSVTGQRVPTTTTSYTIFPQQGAVQGPYSPGPNNTVRLNAITGPTAATPQGVTIEAIRKPHIPGTVPGDLHKGYTVRDKITVPKATIATAGRILARAAPPLFIAATLYDALTDSDISWNEDEEDYFLEQEGEADDVFRATASTHTVNDSNFSTPYTSNGGSCHVPQGRTTARSVAQKSQSPSVVFDSYQNLCNYNGTLTRTTGTGECTWQVMSDNINLSGGGVRRTVGCMQGTFNRLTANIDVFPQYQCVPPSTGTPPNCVINRPATDSEIETAVLDRPDNLFPNYLSTLMQPDVKAVSPVNVPADAPATLEIQDPITKTWLSDATVIMGSSSPQTSQSTTVNPDGSTRTETTQTVTELTTTVGGDTITNNYIQNTTTNTTTTTVTITNTDNTTTTTTTTTVNNAPAPAPAPPTPDPDATPPPVTQDPPPDEPEEVPTFEDSDFPEVPELYVQKYPDGLMGVWAEKGPELMATDFMDAVASMIPDFDDSGQCPVWSMNFNWFSVAQWGTKPITAPCSLFELAGLIFIITSMFASWRIIFGG